MSVDIVVVVVVVVDAVDQKFERFLVRSEYNERDVYISARPLEASTSGRSSPDPSVDGRP